MSWINVILQNVQFTLAEVLVLICPANLLDFQGCSKCIALTAMERKLCLRTLVRLWRFLFKG